MRSRRRTGLAGPTALERVPGVLEAKADFGAKRAEAIYDPDQVSPDELAEAVTRAGFPATLQAK